MTANKKRCSFESPPKMGPLKCTGGFFSELSLAGVLIKNGTWVWHCMQVASWGLSSECEVMFVFLSCSDTRGVDRTLCLHLRCPPFSCLWSCIMKSLHTVKFETSQTRVAPSPFLVLFLPSKRQDKGWNFLFIYFFYNCTLYPVFHPVSSQSQESDSFHTNRKMLWNLFWLISAPTNAFIFSSSKAGQGRLLLNECQKCLNS